MACVVNSRVEYRNAEFRVWISRAFRSVRSSDSTYSVSCRHFARADDDSLLEASSARAIGEIKILFYRVRGMVPRYEQDYVPPPQAQKVHERAKKGLAHNVK